MQRIVNMHTPIIAMLFLKERVSKGVVVGTFLVNVGTILLTFG